MTAHEDSKQDAFDHQRQLVDQAISSVVCNSALVSEHKKASESAAAFNKALKEDQLNSSKSKSVRLGLESLFKGWMQQRLLSSYPFIFVQHHEVLIRDEKSLKPPYEFHTSKLVYVMGITPHGDKQPLSIAVAPKFSHDLSEVLFQDLYDRGATSVGAFIYDAIVGFLYASKTIYPDADRKLCMHQLTQRAIKRVNPEDHREMIRSCKNLYNSSSYEEGEKNFNEFKSRWGTDYPAMVNDWHMYRSAIWPYLIYPKHMKKAVIAKNNFDSLNKSVMRAFLKKSVFYSSKALGGLVVLGAQSPPKTWRPKVAGWSKVMEDFKKL